MRKKEILVKLTSKDNLDDKINQLEIHGLKFKKDACINRLLLFEVEKDNNIQATIDKVNKLGFVERAEPNIDFMANDADIDELDAEKFESNHVPAIWSVEQGSEDIDIAVIDTGIDFEHEALQSIIDKQNSYDFIQDKSDYYKPEDHGTHVAGLVASAHPYHKGAMHKANIIGLRVLAGNGRGTLEEIIEAIEYAAGNHPKGNLDEPVDVINMSLGAPRGTPLLREAIENAKEAGVILVAATGNDADNPHYDGGVHYPANYEDVIACGAVDFHLNIASFSNYGSNVDYTAPGVRVRSTLPDDSFGPQSGTSMASPILSGFIGLLLSQEYSKDEIEEVLDEILFDTEQAEREHYGRGIVFYDYEKAMN